MITKFKIFEKKRDFDGTGTWSMWAELHRAISFDDKPRFKELIEMNPSIDEINGVIGSKEPNCDLLLMAAEYADYKNDDLYFVIELTKLGADWFIKNDDGKYFLDYGNDNQNEQLKKLFPDLYSKYLLRKEEEKYNL